VRVEQSTFCSDGEWRGQHRHTSLGGLNPWDENTKSDLVVGSDNGAFLVVPLSKAFFCDWTFYGVKTQDLSMLVGPDDDNVAHYYTILEPQSWRTFSKFI
jgi:hypothetical protein